MEAPDGQDVGYVLDRMGDFSPCLPRLPIPRRLGFVPTKGNLPRTVAKAVTQDHRRALPARPPL